MKRESRIPYSQTALLDDLKETLWKVCDEDIIAQQQTDLLDQTDWQSQLDLEFDDRIPF